MSKNNEAGPSWRRYSGKASNGVGNATDSGKLDRADAQEVGIDAAGAAFRAALLANVNAGGENCHRGAALGALFGAAVGLSKIPAALTVRTAVVSHLIELASQKVLVLTHALVRLPCVSCRVVC